MRIMKVVLVLYSTARSCLRLLDILARLSIYLLSDPSPSFATLLKPLFNPQSIPETLLVILLDWNEPWAWARQLRDWIILIRSITTSLPDDSKQALEEIMKEWKEKKRGISSYDAGATSGGNETNVALPLGQGEWDEPLGLPLCVVCHNVRLSRPYYVQRQANQR